jgi:hypothetical protein
VQLNKDCDANAKRFLNNDDPVWHSLPTAAPSPSAMVSLFINNQLVTNNMKHRLITAWSSISARVYLLRQEEWSETILDTAAWDMMEQCLDAMHQSSKARFARLVKFMMDMPHISAQKHKFTSKKEYISTVTNLCPCCRMEEESSISLYECRYPQIRNLLLKVLDSIEEKIQQ